MIGAGAGSGSKLLHRSVNYFFVFKKKWIDSHISVMDPKDADGTIFTQFDKGLSSHPDGL